jgi:excisionase family DNA binding protein
MRPGGRLLSVVGCGDEQLADVRRRAAVVERAASDLAVQVQRLTAEVTELAERPTERPKAFSVDEAARSLSLSRTSLYELLDSGRIRSVKVGSRRLVPTAALDEFLAGAGGPQAS